MLFAFALTGLPGSTTAGPSLPNQAPQASITFLRSASDAGGAPPPLYTSKKFAIRRLLVQLCQPWGCTSRDDEPRNEKSTRTRPKRARLAAHPADELLDLDLVEPPHDPSTAEPAHRKKLTVEVFPLLPGGRVAVDRTVFERDAHLVEQVGHRDGLARAVRAVENGVCCAVRLSIHPTHASLTPAIKQIDCSDRSHKR